MSNLESEIRALHRSVRNTRIGGVLGLLAVGGSLVYGVHHLGVRHHETFSEFYKAHQQEQMCPLSDNLEELKKNNKQQ